MSTTSTTTPSAEWVQFYEQSAFDEVAAASHSDATAVTTNLTSDANLSPGSSSPGKSTRRRSRASKRAPTTLLNANTSNFRALVQQFTGCPSSSRDLSRRSGFNLNFSQGNEGSAQSQSNVSASTMATFGTNYYFQHPGQPQPWPPQQQHHMMFQNQQNDVHIDNVSTQGFPADPYSSEHRNDGYFF